MKTTESRCNCCTCQGIHCILDHEDHDHSTRDQKRLDREQREMVEEALRMNF